MVLVVCDHINTSQKLNNDLDKVSVWATRSPWKQQILEKLPFSLNRIMSSLQMINKCLTNAPQMVNKSSTNGRL